MNLTLLFDSQVTGPVKIDPSAPPDPRVKAALDFIKPAITIPELSFHWAPNGEPVHDYRPDIAWGGFIILIIIIILIFGCFYAKKKSVT